MFSLIFLVFISFINLSFSWLTADQMGHLAGVAFGAGGNAKFKMFRMILDNVNNQNQFITRILNPGDVNKIYEYFGGAGDLAAFAFTQTGEPTDLLDFFRKGENPEYASPTSSGTWDPSIHGRVVQSRRNNEKLDNNMGIYRSLFADPDFPIITLTYNIRDVRNVNFDSAVAQKMRAAATYSGDDRATSKLIIPPLQDQVCYYDTSATQNHLDFLNSIYEARKLKPGVYTDYPDDPVRQQYRHIGVGDAHAWHEVVIRGATTDVENSWTIAAAQLAYISIWSYDPSQTRTAYVALNGRLKYTLAAADNSRRVTVVDALTPIPAAARLAIKIYTVNGANRVTIKNFCGKFLYLYPNVQTHVEGDYIGWKPYLTAQKAARATLLENDATLRGFITSAPIQTKLKKSYFQSSLFHAHSKTFTATSSDEVQLPPQFSLTTGNRQPYFVDEFAAIWKCLWMGDNPASPAPVVIASDTIQFRLKKFLNAWTQLKDLDAIWTKFYEKWGRDATFFTEAIIAEYELPVLPPLGDFLEMDEEIGQNVTKKQILKKSQSRLMP